MEANLNSKERGLPLGEARIEAMGLIFKGLNHFGVLECASLAKVGRRGTGW